jgi:cytidine deaminase
MEAMEFAELLMHAREVLNPRRLSKNVEAGSVAAALLADDGKVYRGVCIDTPCGMGFCAEHSAAAAMVTAGVSRVIQMVAVGEDGRVVPPCGRCREFIRQLDPKNGDCLVLVREGMVKSLWELLPDSWEK